MAAFLGKLASKVGLGEHRLQVVLKHFLVHLLQTDDVAVVSSQLMKDQFDPIVDMKRIWRTRGMEYSPAELRVAVQIGQDVIRDYAQGGPVQGGGGPHVPRVRWQLAWSKSDRGRDSTEKKMPAEN